MVNARMARDALSIPRSNRLALVNVRVGYSMQAPNINALDGTFYEHYEGGIVGRYSLPILLPEPFFVVDAGFLEFFKKSLPFTHLHRSSLTYGSVEYRFQGKKDAPIAAIVHIRALSNTVTQMILELGEFVLESGHGLQDELGEQFIRILLKFGEWMAHQHDRAARLFQQSSTEKRTHQIGSDPIIDRDQAKALQENINHSMPQKRPGRPSPKEDDWAWNQVNTEKRPREVVRVEWIDRMDEKRRSELKDIKRSFRHAIDPERRRKE
jgi:hypothetical protein